MPRPEASAPSPMPTGAPDASGPGRFVPAGERVILLRRPSPWWIVMRRGGWILVPASIAIALAWAWPRLAGSPLPVRMGPAIALWTLAVLGYHVLAWLSRRYVLTDRRVVVVAGIIARDVGDVPLERVQHGVVTQSWWERLLGLGTVGVATAGGDGPVVRWLSVDRPDEVLAAIRAAMARVTPAGGASPAGGAGETGAPRAHAERAWRPVIGIAGGVGSGKSTVARALEVLGCAVVDSDREARQVMLTPAVRDELVRWWGPGVLDGAGEVDRARVANIVFADAEQRRRLEGLIHPLVRAHRAEFKAHALASGAAGVVVDAPLLFEAGVDKECDCVVFVDAPREARLARVRATRGWDEAELARREASQMPLEEKRARSTFVVRNDGPPEAVAAEVARVWAQIQDRFPALPRRG